MDSSRLIRTETGRRECRRGRRVRVYRGVRILGPRRRSAYIGVGSGRVALAARLLSIPCKLQHRDGGSGVFFFVLSRLRRLKL